MYKELDEYIKYYENDETSINCYWEELGYEYAAKTLSKFTRDDWDKLFSELDHKSDVWKKRLIYSMYETSNDMKIKVITKIVNTNDISLFELLLVRVMNCDLSEINNSKDFVNKIKQFSNTQSKMTQNIFLSFLKKLKADGQSSKRR